MKRTNKKQPTSIAIPQVQVKQQRKQVRHELLSDWSQAS